MPFQNGVFKRLFSWQADAQAGKGISPVEFDQDGDDVAAALSNTLLRDGTGVPTADVSWNGKKLTNLAAPASNGDALSLGQVPTTEVVRALGYTPARPPSFTNCSSGGLSDISTAPQLVAYVDFTMGASTFLGIANTTFACQTSGGIAAAHLNCDLIDNATGNTMAVSGDVPINILNGQGFAMAVAKCIATGLVVGRSYRFRTLVFKNSSDVQVAMNSTFAEGIMV